MTVRQHYGPLARRVRHLVDLVVSDIVATPAMQGRIWRIPPVEARYERDSTAEAQDSRGESYVVGPHGPALQVTAGRVGVLLRPAEGPRAVETLTLGDLGAIVPHSGYCRYVDRGAGSASGSVLLHWGGDTGPRMALVRGSDGLRAVWSGDPDDVASEVAGHAAPGAWVEVVWRLSAAGRVRVSRRYDGGAWVEGALSDEGLTVPRVPDGYEITVGGGPEGVGTGGIELQALRIDADPAVAVDHLIGGTGG